MQLSWHANTWYPFLSITEWFCFQKGIFILTFVGTASAVRVAIGLTPDWQIWAGRSSLCKDKPNPSVTGTVSLVSALYLHSYQEYFASAIHEYSAFRKVIIQTNSTAIQGRLCLSQRTAIFDYKEGRKGRKKERKKPCSAVLVTAGLWVKTIYIKPVSPLSKGRSWEYWGWNADVITPVRP